MAQQSKSEILIIPNIRSVKKDTKRSSVLLLRLVSFFTERTLSQYLSEKTYIELGLLTELSLGFQI
jgi:hypothetical protein